MEKLEMQELSGNEDCRNRVFPLLAIAFACFILHGLILLNERPFWDGLLLFHLLRTGNWPEIRTWFHDAGLPSFAYIYWGVGAWVPFPVLAFRLLTFSSLLATSWFFYGICRYFNLSRSTSTQLAVLACAYPIHQVSVEIIMAPGNFMIALFYLSALFAFYAARHSGWKRWCLWGSSLIGFFFSFVQESLLTFYLGFLILYLWNRVREGENRSNTQIRSWIKTLARNLDYLVVPVVYLILKRLFFWPTGSFAAYNRVKLSPWNLADNTWISLKNGLFFHLDCAFAFYSLSQILLIFALVSFLGKRSISSGSDRTAERAESIGMGLVGVALWFLGMVLYVLAQKPLMAVGTETRYAMLLGPPTSLLILATLRYWIPVPRYRGTIYALLLFAFSVVTWKSHLDWQGRTVKDMAIIRSLKKTPPPKDYTSFMVQDDLPMISKRGDQIYRVYGETIPYEWAVLFHEADPSAQRIAVAVQNEQEHQEFVRKWKAKRACMQCGLDDWQPDDKVCRMKIHYGAPDWGSEKLTTWDPCGVGWRFLILKLTRPLERRNEFLDNLLRIEFLDKDTLKPLSENTENS